MKLLNLDELTVVTRSVLLKGTRYDVAEVSVGQFIDAMKKASEVEARIAASGKVEPDEQLIAMVAACQEAIPSCPNAVLRSLSFPQLAILLRFINGDDAQATTEAKPEADGKKS